MRVFVLLALVLFLAGCSGEIKIEDYHLIEEYSEGNTTHYFQFTLRNPSFRKAECKARLDLGETEKIYFLGEVNAMGKTRFIVPFEMPAGEINLSLEPICSFK
ncbi:hypothetical protein KY345_00330 [Candidatus Woesearchaeota archaeon]|nr:hypothetical protein [Candidatus Woesearchaeota archaeon]